MQRFRAARPAVEIELHERPTADQLLAIAAGGVDVGLVRLPIEASDELVTRVVMREPSVAALPAGHPLAARRRVPLARLAAEPLVLFPREPGSRLPRSARNQPCRRRPPT